MTSEQGDGAEAKLGAAPAQPAPKAAAGPSARQRDAAEAASSPDAAKRGSAAGTGAGAGGSRRGWLSKAAAKLPLKWVTTAVLALFLGVTALFGGLETAEAAIPDELGAGDTHEGPMVALTVQRAILIDDFGEGGAWVEEASGDRVLVLDVLAENVSDEPVHTLGDNFGEIVRLDALPDQPLEGSARFDDGTLGPTLQPGLPAPLVLSWIVEADAFAEGDEVRVQLHDHELFVGSSVLYGKFWDEPEVAAYVTVTVEDVGAGADAEAQP